MKSTLKNDIIEYFVDEYYSNFKELINTLNDKKLKQMLSKNIKKIITNKKSFVYVGRYFIVNKRITLYNKSKDKKTVTIDYIKENIPLKTTMLHEFTHALFRRNIVTTGLFTINFSPSIFYKYPRNVVKNRGINEGLTNWVVQKCGLNPVSYKLETNIINQLSLSFGVEKILNLCFSKSKNAYKELELTKKEFKYLSKMFDNINFFEIKMLKTLKIINFLNNIRFKLENKSLLNFKERLYCFINLNNSDILQKKINNKNNKLKKFKNKRNINGLDLQKFISKNFINCWGWNFW